jgi:hypothetical protein
MNRAFTAISLQAAVATAILTLAPLAGAATAAPVDVEAHGPQLAPFVSQLSREQVRADATTAAHQFSNYNDHQHEQPAAAGSVLTRAQVHAEAVQANLQGSSLTGEYENALGVSARNVRIASATLAAAR